MQDFVNQIFGNCYTDIKIEHWRSYLYFDYTNKYQSDIRHWTR